MVGIGLFDLLLRGRAAWVEFALLGTPVVLWVGWPFFVRKFALSLDAPCSPNMWTLIG